MFTYLSQYAEHLHSKAIQTILLAALAILIVSVVLASFVRWLRQRRQERPDNWAGLVTSSMSNVLKSLVGLAIVFALGMHLKFQGTEFARTHGGISEKNYDAVQQIWGRPHVQGELSVHLARYQTKYYDKDGLEFDAAKLKATSQLVAFRETQVQETVPGNPVAQADHDVSLTMNYRKKGNATYPGFDVDCKFSYVLVNPSDKPLTAECSFPMPTNQGMVDKLTLSVDGSPLATADVSTTAVAWKMPMDMGQKKTLTVSYHSRGLDYIRFDPVAGQQINKYRLRLHCMGVKENDLNSAIGCMTPTLKKEMPDQTLLEWNLDQAVTRLGMGMILPKAKEAGYHVARVLSAAPWGLVLLLAAVLVTHLVTSSTPRYGLLLLLTLAFDLYYLLMANLGNYWPGLTGGIIFSSLALTALVALVYWRLAGRFIAASTVAFFVVFCAVYPLIVISDYDELLLSVLYVAMLAYVIVLLIRQKRQENQAAAS